MRSQKSQGRLDLFGRNRPRVKSHGRQHQTRIGSGEFQNPAIGDHIHTHSDDSRHTRPCGPSQSPLDIIYFIQVGVTVDQLTQRIRLSRHLDLAFLLWRELGP